VSVGTLMFRYTASDAAAPVWPTGLSRWARVMMALVGRFSCLNGVGMVPLKVVSRALGVPQLLPVRSSSFDLMLLAELREPPLAGPIDEKFRVGTTGGLGF